MKKSGIKCIILMMLVFFAAFKPVMAYADDKEYSVDYAEFEVDYDENSGDAFITEKWDVTYIKGDFTRFYKDIYNPDNQLEHFEDINIISCSINGKEAQASKSVDRVDNHYYFEKKSSDKTDTVHWFLHASGETVHYEVKYRVVNAVKLDEYNRAVFCYRFVGENFPKTVGKTKVIVNIPVMDDETAVTVSTGNYSFDGNTLIGEASSVSDMLKYRISMSEQGFSGLQRIIDVEVPKSNPFKISDIIMVIIFGGAMLIFFVLFPLYALISFVSRKIYISAMLRKNPSCFTEAAERLENSRIPFMWYLAISNPVIFSANPFIVFYIELFDLCSKGRISVKEDELHIFRKNDTEIWDKKASDCDDEFVNLLFRYFSASGNAGGYPVIAFSTMKSTLGFPTKCAEFIKDIKKWSKKYKKQLSEMPQYRNIQESREIKQIKADLKFWKKYAASAKLSMDAYQCMGIAQRTGSVSNFMVLQFINAYRRTPKVSGLDSEIYTFCDFMDYDARTYSDNSSGGGGCSSCSSCSSCGGCGGGGAD